MRLTASSRRKPTPQVLSQRGAALLAALLIVALVTSLLGDLLWHENLRVQTLRHQRDGTQARWLSRGILDWARLILREDLFRTPGVDHLGEVWAAPIAPTPLSEFVRLQGGPALDLEGDLWLEGSIVDATGRFNLTSLVDVLNPAGDRGWVAAARVNPEALMIFGRLLQVLGMDTTAAPAIANQLLVSRPAQLALADGPLPPLQLADLVRAAPRLSTDQWAILANYTVILPRPTPVNANTASPEVLAAVLGITLSQAGQVVAMRSPAFFTDYSSLQERIQMRFPQVGLVSPSGIGVSSEYFWVLERLRQGDSSWTQHALVARRMSPGNATEVLWQRSGWPPGLDSSS